MTAAYGSPAVTLRCGVPEPRPNGDYTCLAFGAQDWLVIPRAHDTVYQTYGTSPALEVRVPDAYDAPPLDGLADLVRALPRNAYGSC